MSGKSGTAGVTLTPGHRWVVLPELSVTEQRYVVIFSDDIARTMEESCQELGRLMKGDAISLVARIPLGLCNAYVYWGQREQVFRKILLWIKISVSGL